VACHFRAPVRSSAKEYHVTDKELALGELYRLLIASDVKSLLNQKLIILAYSDCHPLLLVILKVQVDLAVAGRILDTTKRKGTVIGKDGLAACLKPTIGVRVSCQPWFKERGIKHCLGMSHGRMSVEEENPNRECCQIYVDLSKGYKYIHIISKASKLVRRTG